METTSKSNFECSLNKLIRLKFNFRQLAKNPLNKILGSNEAPRSFNATFTMEDQTTSFESEDQTTEKVYNKKYKMFKKIF